MQFDPQAAERLADSLAPPAFSLSTVPHHVVLNESEAVEAVGIIRAAIKRVKWLEMDLNEKTSQVEGNVRRAKQAEERVRELKDAIAFYRDRHPYVCASLAAAEKELDELKNDSRGYAGLADHYAERLAAAETVVEAGRDLPFDTLAKAIAVARVQESNPRWGQARDLLDRLAQALQEYDRG